MKRVLLVEPAYVTKYPPLALMKISSYHKALGDTVNFVKGINEGLDHNAYDIVYITSLYTYDASVVLNTIIYYKTKCINADIIIGGIYATLMPEHVKLNSGITPHIGLWKDVEFIPPDYSLLQNHPWADYSFLFTSRGCPNKCGFCAVKYTEPESIINERWKEHISLNLPNIMIHDNNLTAVDFNHYEKVMNYLASIKKSVTFDNGLDCRKFNEKHCRLLTNVNLKSLRFAFDNMNQDGYIQKAIKLCLKYGLPAQKILVYVLFNYKDTLKEALYRAREIARLGVRPYAMQYIPLDITKRSDYFYGEWNKNLSKDFVLFVNECHLAAVMDFKEWQLKWKGKRLKTRDDKY